MENDKPPLGVMPRDLWLSCRAAELARAINDYIRHDRIMSVKGWVVELNEVMNLLGDYKK